MKDAHIIEGLINHDSKIINQIYADYSERIRHHIRKHGGTADDAKDVFHNALMMIYQKAKSGNFELTSRFYTYFFSVCHFMWDREKKKKSNNTVTFKRPDRLMDVKDIEADMEAREKHNIFREQFKKLDDLCQKILEYFFQRKSMTEIAEQLQLQNEHTARTRKYRCQKKLEGMVRNDVRFKDLRQSL